MTRVKPAWMALRLLGGANAALILVTWPRPTKVAEIATMIICACFLWLSYREDPARFHRRISVGEAIRVVIAVVLLLGAVILLTTIHLL